MNQILDMGIIKAVLSSQQIVKSRLNKPFTSKQFAQLHRIVETRNEIPNKFKNKYTNIYTPTR